jgi:hypothetical protein
LISTALVAVGIAFEYPEVRHEFIEWLRSRKKAWVVEVVPANRNRVPLWSLVGFLIVVAGIAGEGIYEGLLGINDTRIRKMDESSIAADELKITGMNLALETEKNKTAAAEYNAAAAEKDLWILGLTNQKSTGELASLVFAHTERTIDQKILSDSVAGKPKMRVEVLYKREDVESFEFATQICHALGSGEVPGEGAGWSVAGPIGLPFGKPDEAPAEIRYLGQWSGIAVVSSRRSGSDETLDALVKGLQASLRSPFRVPVEFLPDMPNDLIRIVVTQKH